MLRELYDFLLLKTWQPGTWVLFLIGVVMPGVLLASTPPDLRIGAFILMASVAALLFPFNVLCRRLVRPWWAQVVFALAVLAAWWSVLPYLVI